jgi:phenylpropionate dioxygenase-like ring-hydroxylating dioxygenase large terminal subunit
MSRRGTRKSTESRWRCEGDADQVETRTQAICARVFPVVERHRLVWISDAARRRSACARLLALLGARWTFDGGYNHIACDYRLVIDNLMNPSHETYVHRGSVGEHEILESPIETKYSKRNKRELSGIPTCACVDFLSISGVPAPVKSSTVS